MDFPIDQMQINQLLEGYMYKAKDTIPNRLFCKRESRNELLILSFTPDDNKVERSTGLTLTAIDLSQLNNPNEQEKLSNYYCQIPIQYTDYSQSGGGDYKLDFSLCQEDYPLLTNIDVPHKIFMNQRDNIMVIQSQHYVGIVTLGDELLCNIDDLQLNIQLIGCDEDPHKIDTEEYFFDVKFHPLTSYTLCILNDRNSFKMYDVLYSIDRAFFDYQINVSDSNSKKKEWNLVSSKQSKITGFEFGSQAMMGWQILTCYFITSTGSVYYLTPLLPLKFGLNHAFASKMYEKATENSMVYDLLALIMTKKELIFNDDSTHVIILSEKDIKTYYPQLQGPVNNPLMDTESKNDF